MCGNKHNARPNKQTTNEVVATIPQVQTNQHIEHSFDTQTRHIEILQFVLTKRNSLGSVTNIQQFKIYKLSIVFCWTRAQGL